MLNSTIIIIGCHYQINFYRMYIHRLTLIDWQLHTCGGTLSYLSTRRFLRKILLTCSIFFCCVFITDFMYNQMDVKSFFRSSTVYSVPNIISVLALSEYIALLFSIRERYRKIIEILLLLPTNENCSMNHLKIKEKIKIFNIFPVQRPKLPRILDQTLSASTLDTLRIVCLDLTDLYLDVNSSFGILIISTVVSTFLILSIQFYAIYVIMEDLQENDPWLTFYTGLWIVLHGGKSFFVLYYNNAVNNEVGYFSYIINIIRRKS